MMDIHFSCDGHLFVAPEESSVSFAIGETETHESRTPLPAQGEPVFVFSLDHGEFPAPKDLEWELRNLLAHDDVTQDGFLKTLLINDRDGNFCISEEDRSQYNVWGWEFTIIATSSPVPIGPYYAFASELRQVFRLYEDPFEAFVFGMISRGGSNQS
jgi:hypothetical protein